MYNTPLSNYAREGMSGILTLLGFNHFGGLPEGFGERSETRGRFLGDFLICIARVTCLFGIFNVGVGLGFTPAYYIQLLCFQFSFCLNYDLFIEILFM